jgi:uncharacterized protein
MRGKIISLVALLLTAPMARAVEPAAAPPASTPDLAYGAYQRGDYANALAEAKKRLAANPKDGAALALLGRLYAEGSGVKKDRKQSLTYFKSAADFGDREAAYLFGASALIGRDMPQDRGLAQTYLEKAAKDHPAALNLLGEVALENNGVLPDFDKAIGYFRRAAKGENSDAEYSLGVLYRHGKGVAKNDAEAANWFRQAADASHPAAMVELAIMQFNGAGVAKDQAGAVKLLRSAAIKGNAVAQNRLAHLLAEGLSVEKNLNEARKWRDLSHESGLMDPALDLELSAPDPKAPPASGN